MSATTTRPLQAPSGLPAAPRRTAQPLLPPTMPRPYHPLTRHLPLPFPRLPLPLLLLLLLPVTLAHPHPPPHLIHTIDDIAPAFANATAAGLTKAEAILTHYSDILRILAIPLGLVICFFGYFLLSPVLFIAAFLSGGGACFIATSALIGDSTPLTAWISIISMMVGGALFGFLALHILPLGMFGVGAALGVVIAAALKTSVIARAYPDDVELGFRVVAVGCGLVFGLIALCLRKEMLMFCSAYAGAGGCMYGVGRFAGHFPTEVEIGKVEEGVVDGWVVGYLVGIVVLGTGGLGMQFWLGRNKEMVREAPGERRRRRRREREREEMMRGWSEDDEAYWDVVARRDDRWKGGGRYERVGLRDGRGYDRGPRDDEWWEAGRGAGRQAGFGGKDEKYDASEKAEGGVWDDEVGTKEVKEQKIVVEVEEGKMETVEAGNMLGDVEVAESKGVEKKGGEKKGSEDEMEAFGCGEDAVGLVDVPLGKGGGLGERRTPLGLVEV